MTRILVVDDDPHLREVLNYTLARQGWEIREASDGAAALQVVRNDVLDLVVLDVVMPELDGIETCRKIRSFSSVPIVFLSSRDEELDRILGLEMGGDDYLTKPFSPRELVSRIKAVLRRARPVEEKKSELLQVGPLRLDGSLHRVWVKEAEITLTVTEFSILQALMKQPGRAFDRDAITERAYGENHHISDRTLDSHIRRIRQKCREYEFDPIETVFGLGYRLRAG